MRPASQTESSAFLLGGKLKGSYALVRTREERNSF
jgi:hypothetical protein